ncbi:hypothetical protein PsYK624_155750 [Phanerochaete sordida]|uniref:Uncharacterized protein n=1 Tax=Phanerochaete sordida TaxID=48140 RepID=A0A9P3GQI6_9APHY|nr:hypothetical protein PsYK624_155750 [Phanerochaete sordida]
MAPPPTPSPAASGEELRALHTQLMSDIDGPHRARYMGNKDLKVLDELTWVRHGSCDFLVHADDAAEYEAKRALHANDPTENPAPDAPNSAMFSMVGRLANKNFYLSSCAGWNGSYGELEGVVASALLEPADVTAFSGDWDCMVKNFERIVASKHTQGRIIKGAWDEASGEPKRLRVRTKIFQEIDPNDEDAANVGLPSEFTIAKWPPTPGSAKCAEKLDELRKGKKHIVNPVPVFGRNGALIFPSEYRELRDTLVVVYFTFIHWFIAGDKDSSDPKKGPSDTFGAEILNMKVLAPPRPRTSSTPKTPVKRWSLRDPMASPSPPKRRRT